MLVEQTQRMNNAGMKTFRKLHYDRALVNQTYCPNDVAYDAHTLLLQPELKRPPVDVAELVGVAYSY